jgi:hypothetical protein
MISSIQDLFDRFRTSVHMLLWHNALVPEDGSSCDACLDQR